MGNPRKGGLSRLGFYRIVSEVRLILINDPLFQPFFLLLWRLFFFFFIHFFIFIYYFLFSSLLLLISLLFFYLYLSRRNERTWMWRRRWRAARVRRVRQKSAMNPKKNVFTVLSSNDTDMYWPSGEQEILMTSSASCNVRTRRAVRSVG